MKCFHKTLTISIEVVVLYVDLLGTCWSFYKCGLRFRPSDVNNRGCFVCVYIVCLGPPNEQTDTSYLITTLSFKFCLCLMCP